MSRIFISHSSKDNEQAEAFGKWLSENGWDDYFLDLHPEKGLTPGERWQEALKAAADRCEAVVFLISPHWVASKWCQAEFLLAKQLGKTLFGVLITQTPFDSLPIELTAEWQLADWTENLDANHARLKRGLEQAGLDPSTFLWPPKDDPNRSPYRGLKALEEIDAAVFFGRNADTVRGLDSIRRIRQEGTARLMVILGASGAGKSSFLRAGLLPRLSRDTQHFLTLPVVRPGRGAISGETGLAVALEQAQIRLGISETRGEITRSLFKTGSEGFGKRIHAIQQAAHAAYADNARRPPTILLSLDQTEELFGSDQVEESEKFLSSIVPLLKAPSSDMSDKEAADLRRLFVCVATIRSDTYELLQQHDAFTKVDRIPFDLSPILPGAYSEVIEGPANRHSLAGKSLEIEPELTEALLKQNVGGDALPLLAFTLEQLYHEYGSDGDLRLDEYNALGGIQGSIEKAVDEAISSVQGKTYGDPFKLLRDAFFPKLITLADVDDVPLRRVANVVDLPEKSKPLINAFVEHRLLRTDTDNDVITVEISHEALLRQWPQMTRWIDEERANLRLFKEIQQAAKNWIDNKDFSRVEDWLIHRGTRLHDAEKLYRKPLYQSDLIGNIKDYIEGCRKLEDETRRGKERDLQEKEAQIQKAKLQQDQIESDQLKINKVQRLAAKRNRRNLWINLALLSGVLAISAGALTGFDRLEIIQKQTIAASALDAIQLGHDDQAIRFALLANESSMLGQKSKTGDVAMGHVMFKNRFEASLRGHDDSLTSATFSSDGQRIVTASRDNTARVWSVDNNGQWLAQVLQGHVGSVTSATFSADGRRIVTASRDNTARVWSVDDNGQWFPSVLRGHSDSVTSANFSPDGQRIATASWDNTVRVWSVDDNGQWLSNVLQGHDDLVTSATFSPDGQRIVTASWDNTARVWSVDDSGQWLSNVIRGHYFRVTSANFSRDGQRIVTASLDNTARVWSVDDSGQWVAKLLQGHVASVTSATFSPDGQRIVTASLDNTARVWAVDDNGQWIAQILQGHIGSVTSATFSPDGQRIITASLDNTSRVWSVTDNGQWRSNVLKGHDGSVASATFSPDGQRIVTASLDNTARVWAVDDNGQWPPNVLRGHDDLVTSATFSPDGQRIVTASWDNTARVWSVDDSGQWLANVLTGHDGSITSVTFSADGQRIVTASLDNTARVWSVDANGHWLSDVLGGHNDFVTSAIFSPNSQRIVTASRDNTARVWSVNDKGKWLPNVLRGHDDLVTSAAFSPDSQRIVTASWDHTARVWSVDDEGKWLPNVLRGHNDLVTSATFSPDGQLIVTASRDSTARVWSVDASGQWFPNVLRGHDDLITSATFSPDGQLIVTASWDNTARVWSADANGQWLANVLKGHNDFVTSAIFSPDSQRIVTASRDNTTRVWSVDDNGQWLAQVLQGHENTVTSATFSPDGQRIVTSSGDNTARVWIVKYLSGKGDFYNAYNHTLVEHVCLYSFNTSHRLQNKPGEPKTVFHDRLITHSDTIVQPLLSGRIGDDVCQLHLDSPWWYTLHDVRQWFITKP